MGVPLCKRRLAPMFSPLAQPLLITFYTLVALEANLSAVPHPARDKQKGLAGRASPRGCDWFRR